MIIILITVVSFVESDRIGGSGFRWICNHCHHDCEDHELEETDDIAEDEDEGMLTSSCPSGGRLMFLTLSRMICRIVFRNAFRNSDVLEEDDDDIDCNDGDNDDYDDNDDDT